MKSIPRIFIAGHKGMVGSALVRFLKNQNVELITKERKELNLLNQQDVQDFFKCKKIDQVYLAAAKVGGIHANNTYPAEFIYENLMIQTNIIHGAFLSNIKKILFLGSSCIYPKNANQPMKEEELLNGKLEQTNEPYAIAKIAGIKMCESYNRQYTKSHGIDFRCIMPTNLYGPGDNYHP
jgi:GDP-L-fucose synthase